MTGSKKSQRDHGNDALFDIAISNGLSFPWLRRGLLVQPIDCSKRSHATSPSRPRYSMPTLRRQRSHLIVIIGSKSLSC